MKNDYIYIASIDGLKSVYKIGMTSAPRVRCGQLKCKYKRKVVMVSIFECRKGAAHNAEKMAHYELKGLIYSGDEISGRELFSCSISAASAAITEAIKWAERYPGIRLKL